MRPRLRIPAFLIVLVVGALMGGIPLLALPGCGDAFVEEPWIKPWASEADVALWHRELEARAMSWTRVPDPPGRGPVARARFWVSRAPYAMEVRRRGSRITLEIHGVDEQELGGGWAAFGEGWIEGADRGFAGCTATFSWSCLGIRYRSASDGFGRIRFSDDGNALHAVYVAHEAGDVWFKSYGERIDGEKPARGSIRGQIPYAPALTRLVPDERHEVEVRVVDAAGAPVPGAVIQLKGIPASQAVADAGGTGRVAFFGREAPFAQGFCAGKEGYYNGETIRFTGDPSGPVTVMLHRADLEDHPSYRWNHPAKDHDPDDAMACATCHTWHYDEWLSSRHARAADNGLVRSERIQMLRIDPEAPDDCTGCHQPGYAASRPDEGYRPRGMRAANHCDFCHKIARVDDLRQSGVSGAITLARPDVEDGERPGGIHHVFGTAPDVTYAYMGAIYNRLFASSHLCASCHQGGGRWRDGLPPKVDTFEEWRRWAVAEAEAERDVKSCQDCHMPGGSTFDLEGGAVDQLAWDALHRDPEAVHSHRFLGREPGFAARALDVRVEKQPDGAPGAWRVRVEVENIGAGHKIPTGSWSKHVVVGIWARDGDRWLAPSGGDRLPALERGRGARAPGDYPGAAGAILGMGADGLESGVPPPFWKRWDPAALVDRRLAPGETRVIEATYVSIQPPDVEVRVVHRRGAYWDRAAFPLRPYDAPPEVEWVRLRR